MTKGRRRGSEACPSCSGWDGDSRHRPTGFTIEGVRHHAPDMWLAARASRHGHGVESFMAACRDWAEQCAMAAAYEAQHA